MENQTRRVRQVYHPQSGVGSQIERVEVEWQDGQVVLLPIWMLEAPGAGDLIQTAIMNGASIADVLEEAGVAVEAGLAELLRVRLKYDFELWCAMGVHIRQKDGAVKPLTLNRPQRRYARILTEEFFSEVPIRIILLKARQWGGSTMTEAFIAWVQCFHRTGWNAAVVADVQDQARHVMGMYRTLAEYYPPTMGSLTFSPYRGSQNVSYVAENDAYIGVASVQNPNAVRSYTYHQLHLSEVGLWKSTAVHSAESLAQALMAGLPYEPHTLCVMESTAKGVGTYFHREWQRAEKGKSNFLQVFVPWFEIDDYQAEVEDQHTFVTSWDEYETYLWGEGATIEGIAWYRRQLRDFQGDRSKMQSEFPSNPQEAFQSSGDRFFAAGDVQRQRKENVSDPKRVGVLKGDAQEGKAALKGIRFMDTETGSLQVWTEPGVNRYGLLKDGFTTAHRYAAFADFGGKTEKADWSVVTIVDRLPTLMGGVPEIAARYRAHLRPDLFAWDAVRLASWYESALLAYEINRHSHDRGDKERGYEPEWSLAVLDEIRGVYDNLYLRQSQSRADEAPSMEIGFHTNSQTKPMIINVLDKALDEDGYIERDAMACDELDTFEKKPNGTLGAVQGGHDDIVISTAGSLWLAISHMPPVVLLPPRPKKRKKRAVGAAVFS